MENALFRLNVYFQLPRNITYEDLISIIKEFVSEDIRQILLDILDIIIKDPQVSDEPRLELLSILLRVRQS